MRWGCWWWDSLVVCNRVSMQYYSTTHFSCIWSPMGCELLQASALGMNWVQVGGHALLCNTRTRNHYLHSSFNPFIVRHNEILRLAYCSIGCNGTSMCTTAINMHICIARLCHAQGVCLYICAVVQSGLAKLLAAW